MRLEQTVEQQDCQSECVFGCQRLCASLSQACCVPHRSVVDTLENYSVSSLCFLASVPSVVASLCARLRALPFGRCKDR